jgi:hypothetical protein
LTLGEIVTVVCPYKCGGNNLERKAELRRYVPAPPGAKALYAFRYLP